MPPTEPPGIGSGDGEKAGNESLADLLGGWRASLDAALPPVAFVAGWLLTSESVEWGVVAALAVSVALGGYRLVRGTRPRAVLLGVLGVLLAAVVVLYTGQARDFFLPRLLSNAASGVAWMISIVLRWPLLGVVVGTLLGQRTRWRRDRALLRAYSIASWAWVMQYVIRTVVLGGLYLLAATQALAVAQVALTWPLVAANIAVSAWLLRISLPDGHPGFRHPRDPDAAEETGETATGSGEDVAGSR